MSPATSNRFGVSRPGFGSGSMPAGSEVHASRLCLPATLVAPHFWARCSLRRALRPVPAPRPSVACSYRSEALSFGSHKLLATEFALRSERQPPDRTPGLETPQLATGLGDRLSDCCVRGKTGVRECTPRGQAAHHSASGEDGRYSRPPAPCDSAATGTGVSRLLSIRGPPHTGSRCAIAARMVPVPVFWLHAPRWWRPLLPPPRCIVRSPDATLARRQSPVP